MTVLEIEKHDLPAVFVVSFHELRHSLMNLCKKRIILNDLCKTVIAHKLVAVYSHDFNMGICAKLLEAILEGACSEVNTISIYKMEAKRTTFGLAVINGKEGENFCLC